MEKTITTTEVQSLTDKTIYQDSLEIGTAKNGAIKVYGDASKPEEFRAKIDEMLNLRSYAIGKLSEVKTE